MNDPRPCKGDAMVPKSNWRDCCWCALFRQSCLGSDGWEFMAKAAAEVALERVEGKPCLAT